MLARTRANAASTLRTFVRGKRDDAGLNSSTQKVVNQLSALSASRKQPKVLNLCKEDLVKHRTIVNAWKLYQSKKLAKKNAQLEKQYESIHNAMSDLKETSPELYDLANAEDLHKRWPLQLRTPSDFPANKPWVYNYAPAEAKK